MQEISTTQAGESASVWSLRKDYWYDADAAYEAVCFFEEEIYHVKGPKAGQLLELEGWQKKFIRRFYGWKRRDPSKPKNRWIRKHKVAFLFLPRKNGKSLLGAGMALYGLFVDGIGINDSEFGLTKKREMGAEVVSAAVDRKQAGLIFDVAKQIIELNPRLHKRCQIYAKSIVVYESASKYMVASADVKNKHGENTSTIVFDELHTQPNGDLVEVLKTGTAAREQPVQAYFTTAGVYDEQSICYQYYLKAKKCAANLYYDPTWLPIIFEVEKHDDWKLRETWIKANPNLGVSVQWTYIEDAFREAQENTREENSFKRLHLNVWTMMMERWLDMEKWRYSCAVRSFNPEDLIGERCFGGIDLSSKVDITAFLLLFPRPNGDLYVMPHFWLPESAIERRSEKADIPYREWVQQGYISATPGERVDYEEIRTKVKELGKLYTIYEIGFDPYMASGIATDLMDDGFEMVEISQSFSNLSEPSKELEALIACGSLVFNGNEVLTWMAGNAAHKEDDRGNIMPSKGRSKEKIDGISALICGLRRALVFGQEDPPSKYEEEGLDFL